jgi:tRNA(fMet)-specific endonuclease VapC
VTDTLVDTDILSELLRARNAQVTARAKERISRTGPLAISAITLMEVAMGLEKAGRIRELDAYLVRLRPLPVLKFTAEEARLAGIIHGALERTGTTIGRADPMIAATALVHDLSNRRAWPGLEHASAPG